MKELDLQDKYLIHFLCKRSDGLKYNEAKANTVSANFFVIEDRGNRIINFHTMCSKSYEIEHIYGMFWAC